MLECITGCKGVSCCNLSLTHACFTLSAELFVSPPTWAPWTDKNHGSQGGQPSFYMPNKTRDLGPWCPWLSMFFLTQWTTYITNIVCTLTDFNAAACCRVSICISWARVGQPAQVPVRHQCSMSSRPAGTGKWWILIGSRTLQDGKERIDSDC